MSQTPVPRAQASMEDSVERILGQCLEQSAHRVESAVAKACREHPELASQLHARLGPLRALGLLGTDAAQEHEGLPQQIGDFRLVRRLGGGGMGVVWEAEQLSLQRRVALKILPPHMNLNASALAMFEREALAGGRLQHDGIVAVYGTGAEQGVHWIAHELVEGGRTLADELARRRTLRGGTPVDYYEMARFFAEIAEAMSVAHGAGVIHRDLKPSNILINPHGRPKIADFGLAKVQDALGISRTGERLGTPFYMSPEQTTLRKLDLDARSDVFSLGTTLYESLTLVRPFDGDTPDQVMAKIRVEDPPDPRKLRSRVPRELAVICQRAMDKKRERRFENMAAFAADLRRFLKRQPIHAKPPGPLNRMEKWTRRHPLVTGGAIATIIVVWQLSSFLIEQNWSNRMKAVLGEIIKLPETKDARTIRTWLLHARKSLEDNLGDRPIEQAHFLHKFGETALDLGDDVTAAEVLSEAIAIRTREMGPNAPDTLESRRLLAQVLRKRGEYIEAEARQRAIASQIATHLGAKTEIGLKTQRDLAQTLFLKRERGEAIEILQAVIDTGEHVFGPGHETLLACKVDLAVYLHPKMEAEDQYLSAIRACRQHLGEDNRETWRARYNLAVLYLERGIKLEHAERDLIEVHDNWSQRYGEFDRRTLKVSNSIAVLWAKKKDFEAAEQRFREVLWQRDRTLGSAHNATIQTLLGLARVYRDWKRFDEAVVIQQDIVTRLDGSANSNHQLAAFILNPKKPIPGYEDLALEAAKLGFKPIENEVMHDRALRHRTMARAYLVNEMVEQAVGEMEIALDHANEKQKTAFQGELDRMKAQLSEITGP